MFKYKHKTSGEVIETANKVTSKNWIPVGEKEHKDNPSKTGDTKKGDTKKGETKKGETKKDDTGKEADGQ